MVSAFVVCLMCNVLFPAREDQSESSVFSFQFTDVSVRVSQSVLFENAAVRISLKSVEKMNIFVVEDGHHRELLFVP